VEDCDRLHGVVCGERAFDTFASRGVLEEMRARLPFIRVLGATEKYLGSCSGGESAKSRFLDRAIGKRFRSCHRCRDSSNWNTN
jgi:hypothetical protein